MINNLTLKSYDFAVSAAGRVNIIGEHVDYCGGKVFPAALNLTNTVYVRKNNSNKINLSWTTLPDKVSLDISNLGDYKGLKIGNYQAGAAYIWQQTGHKIIGCDMLHDCTVPFGSGLSSSAAIEVSTVSALATLAGDKIDKVEIALAALKAEREYAGVNCGVMDQYASACGKKGNAMLLDCKTLKCDYYPVKLGGYSIVITNSNVPHSLVDSKYNERRAETDEALHLLKTVTDISCLSDLSESEFEKHSGILPDIIRQRARHVITECARTELAARAMQSGDIIKLGSLMNASHASLKDCYEVTGKYLDALGNAAQGYTHCVGSRMTGGGFGGCTVSIVKTDKIDEFKKFVAEKYQADTGILPTFYNAEISDGIIIYKQ